MKEAFEKIKEMMEETTFKAELHDFGWKGQIVNNLLCLGDAVDIVNQVAEEYSNSEIPNMSEKPTSLPVEPKSLTEKFNDGWIPCSERLPECDDYAETDALLFQHQTGSIEVGYFGKKNAWRDCYFRHYRSTAGVDASVVVAWMPLPAPYKTKGEQQ